MRQMRALSWCERHVVVCPKLLIVAALVTKGRERHDATVAHIDRLMTISLLLGKVFPLVSF